VARVCPDGTTAIAQTTYNAKGRATGHTDARGRQTIYIYDSHSLDLPADVGSSESLSSRTTSDLVAIVARFKRS
jgi:YD repeat-containing protein